ncbi:MAG: VanW family protein [Firmicutes bacterium]|nr:VanW family protein [Bacillota bacterium]
MKKTRWLIVAVFAIIVTVGLLLVIQPLYWSKVYAGVVIDGIPIGGKSREEVTQLVELWRQEQRNRKVRTYYGDKEFWFDAASIGYDIDVEATVEEAWNFGHYGSWVKRLTSIHSAAKAGHDISLHIIYDEAKLTGIIDQWCEVIDRPPRNAAISLLSGRVVPQEEGRKLDVELVKKQILEAIRNPDCCLPLSVTPLYPEMSQANLEQNGLKIIWASFTTHFDSSNTTRSANIELSANKINGHILYPGQTFSFNEVVGPREKNRGFKEALEIVDGEYVPGIGGGVCQVSSTLYNAVLLANLDVVERTNHSKPLGYVGIGRDATVYYDTLDLKFVNNTDAPIMVLAETRDNTLTVGIAGTRTIAEQVELMSVDRRVIPPNVIKTPDKGLAIGETKVEKAGAPGFEVTTIRVVRSAGREIKREVLAKDSYLAEDTVIKIGVRNKKRSR